MTYIFFFYLQLSGLLVGERWIKGSGGKIISVNIKRQHLEHDKAQCVIIFNGKSSLLRSKQKEIETQRGLQI